MNEEDAQQSGAHVIGSDALVQTCHEMLNAAAVLLANVEYLAGAAVGSNAEREGADADAINSIKRLADQIRMIQDHARQRARATTPVQPPRAERGQP